MELRFLGHTYSTSKNLIDTVDTENMACFRGQRYALRRPVKSLKLKSQLCLKSYRGVAYSTTYNTSV